jgi:catechol 2,3-dioxygenase-like lactoylglutathione lyase family enzyme
MFRGGDDFTGSAESGGLTDRRRATPRPLQVGASIGGREVDESAEGKATGGGAWPGGIAAITLFVEDLAEARRFYGEVFALPVAFEDENSAVFRFGETLVNLLKASEAPGLVEPAAVASPDAGVRFQFTLGVQDVDAMCEELRRRGVEVLNGPMDRPWGIRTASFRDPGGHIWEIAH